jgi:hypothetical protein
MWPRRFLLGVLALVFVIASLVWLRPPQPLPGDLPSQQLAGAQAVDAGLRFPSEPALPSRRTSLDDRGR